MRKINLSPKTVIGLAVGGVLIITLLFSIIITLINSASNQEKKPLIIENIEKYPIKQRDVGYVVDNIYSQTLAELDVNKENPEHTAVIRDGSFSPNVQSLSGKVSFILDVKTAQRSWKVTLNYSSVGILESSGVVTSCLPQSEQIYKSDGQCKDWSMQAAPPDFFTNDPLAKQLPYEGQFFTIDATPVDDYILVAITMQVNSLDDSDVAKENYSILKKRSLEWIKKAGVNPDDYVIEWRDYSDRTIERTKEK